VRKRLRRKPDHPPLQEAIAKVAVAAHRHGKFLGRPAFTADRI
jgi:hypothetical protein